MYAVAYAMSMCNPVQNVRILPVFSGIIALKAISDMDGVSRFDEAVRTKARNGKGEIRLAWDLGSLPDALLKVLGQADSQSELPCHDDGYCRADSQSGSTPNRKDEGRNAECAHTLE